MKVSIDHIEKTQGLLRKTTFHGVQVHVVFSEEERAVIEERDLKYDIVVERGHSADVSESKAQAHDNRGLGRKLLTAAVSGADANVTDLTINKLMKGPDLYFLRTPLEAKEYEDILKNQLVKLKDYIIGNEGVEEKSTTFEL